MPAGRMGSASIFLMSDVKGGVSGLEPLRVLRVVVKSRFPVVPEAPTSGPETLQLLFVPVPGVVDGLHEHVVAVVRQEPVRHRPLQDADVDGGRRLAVREPARTGFARHRDGVSGPVQAVCAVTALSDLGDQMGARLCALRSRFPGQPQLLQERDVDCTVPERSSHLDRLSGLPHDWLLLVDQET